MKIRLTLTSLLLSSSLMAQVANTKTDGKLPYDKKVTTEVTFKNGVKLAPYVGKSAMTAKQVAAAYDKLKAAPPVVVIPPAVTPPVNSNRDTTIGAANGVVSIKNLTNYNVNITPGNYGSMDVANLKNVMVDGGNKVVFSSLSNFSNVAQVTVQNLAVIGSTYRAFGIYGVLKDFTMRNITLRDIQDLAINFADKTAYDGSDASFSNSVQLINFTCDNIGMFAGGAGTISNGKIEGLIRGLRVSGNTITNCPNLNNGTYFGAVEDYSIDNNTLDKVYSSGREHNGILGVFIGNGKVFNNKCTNHWGNLVRCWPTDIILRGRTVEIYNNIVWNSARYSAFELQTPPWLEANALFKPIKLAKVYNNTVGKMNTGEPKYFEGRLLDLYSTHCDVSVTNNLVFDNRDSILLTFGPAKVIEGNVYKATATEAVNNTTEFKSKIEGVGANR